MDTGTPIYLFGMCFIFLTVVVCIYYTFISTNIIFPVDAIIFALDFVDLITYVKFSSDSMRTKRSFLPMTNPPMQEKLYLRYDIIKEYTIDFSQPFETITMSADTFVGRPYIYILGKDDKVYRLAIKKYSAKQVDKILDEIYLRTGIKSLKYTKDWKGTNVFKRARDKKK